MSDAQGPRPEPRDGEPDEVRGDVEPAETTTDAAFDAAADTHEEDATVDDAGETPATRREARTTTGATDVVIVPEDDAAVGSVSDGARSEVASSERAATADEPVIVDEPVAAPEPATPVEPADTPAEPEEPDYAALAADLDALEARGATTPATTPEAEPQKKADPWFEPADKTQTFTASDAYDAPAAAPAITASEPVVPDQTTPVAPPAQLPIFVQAPEPPRLRGNRAAAGGIGLLAAVVFAVLYFGATLGSRALNGAVTAANVGEVSLQLATSFELWVPVAIFFLGFWLLGALVNRARWAAWVLLGIFVGIVAYAGHIAGQLFQAPFWVLTASDGLRVVEENLLSPLAIAAFVFGREITIWFGAWASRRGARITEQNEAAQAEYERTLEAGPKLA
ncbi:DMT family transporter [Microbacterium marinilacus]|uniref:ABC transporter n=1 Tax=Microbacterium marinilacus TaxID=415209 RepID=A0ABP7BBF1_9MICO|nr:DMT family transporter [Microbacterium marinilacus]MBY0690197.1 ABC transporter [Microbacterium marinilacus]